MSKILHLTLILSLLFLSRAAIDLNKWELFAENTKDLSIRGKRIGRVTASGEDVSGFPIYFFNQTTQTWYTEGHRGIKIKLSSREVFYLQKTGLLHFKSVFSSYRASSNYLFATAFAIDEKDDKRLMFYGKTSESPSALTFLHRYERETWQSFPTGKAFVLCLAFEPVNRKYWVLEPNGDIYKHFASNLYEQHPGKANYITFGTTDVPYIVSQEGSDTDGFILKKWNDTTQGWETIPGITGVSMALDDDNNLYVVTKGNKVYRQRGVLSQFCPMCEEANYQGKCTQAKDQCINCIPGTYAAESPLRCEPCPPECPECSSATTCTACPANSFLAPNGTCLTSCDAPLKPITNATGKYCKGPCADEPLDTFYYPSNDTCQATCDLPTSGEFYATCDPCPEDCLECSNTVTCSQCISTSFLTPIGTCRPSCPHPLESFQDSSGVWHCKGPCAAEPTDIYYHAGDNSCRPICSVPILTCSAINL